MKALFVVLDGMADRPVAELGRKTPLQAARTPNMDRLARSGACGIVDPVAPGIPPGSDVANMALLGYDPHEHYTGRGALEALGAGLDLGPGDVAFRCNFATVNENGVVLDRRAGRISTENASVLAEAIREALEEADFGVEVKFVNTVQHRAVLVLKGEALSRAISDTDPKENGKPLKKCVPLDSSPEAKKTAGIVNNLSEFLMKVLREHPLNKELERPANAILFRGAGTLPDLRPLSELYSIRGACISAVALVKGVCKAAGLDILDVPGATGSYDTNLDAKFSRALEALNEGYDLMFVHIKATDVASHDHDAAKKVWFLERVDEALGKALDALSTEDTYVLITSDHTTSVRTGKHEGDPVPAALAGPEVRVDAVERFDEINCSRGSLCRLRGIDLMPVLMNLLGKVERFGF